MSDFNSSASSSGNPNNSENPSYWRKCTSCKKLIGFHQKYYICSVSTCTRKRTGLIFCDVACFDAHVPVLNHKSAGAIEQWSPTLKKFLEERESEKREMERVAQTVSQPTVSQTPRASTSQTTRFDPLPQSTISSVSSLPPMTSTQNTVTEDEILVVVSKVKAYIRDKSGFNTSDSVMKLLSDKIRVRCRDAIRSASNNGRKTVLDRDFK